MRSAGAWAVVLVLVVGGSSVAACSGDSFQGVTSSGGASGSSAGAGAGGRAGSSVAGGGGSTAGAAGTSVGVSGGAGAGIAGASGAGSAGAAGGGAGVGGDAGAGGQGGATAGTGGAAGQGGGPPTFGFDVSNAAQVGGFDPLAVAQISFSAEFDTDKDCGSTKLGTCEEIAAPDNGLPLCVCRGASYSIGDATLTGSRALVLLATKDIKISGTLTVSSGEVPRADDAPDGSGGSFATEGGGASAAKVRGEDTLQPLIAGQRGAGACDVPGGRGGGALQLSAAGTIEIAAEGVVQAGGKAGAGAPKGCTGPGGGSGGAVIIEAGTVNIIGIVAANGASGSGGGTPNVGGKAGSDALPSGEPAPGGLGGSEACAGGFGGTTKGGTGGDGAALVAVAKAGGGPSLACFQQAPNGGGGGGRGRVRLRYRNFQQEGTVSPKPSQITLPPIASD